MAELNLKQIEDRLNEEFRTSGDENRKLVFWYDDRAEFAEDVDSLQLDNAKILHLMPDNQFATKLFLEHEDRTTNYLIYAPFSKPDVHRTIWKIYCSTRGNFTQTGLLCSLSTSASVKNGSRSWRRIFAFLPTRSGRRSFMIWVSASTMERRFA